MMSAGQIRDSRALFNLQTGYFQEKEILTTAEGARVIHCSGFLTANLKSFITLMAIICCGFDAVIVDFAAFYANS